MLDSVATSAGFEVIEDSEEEDLGPTVPVEQVS